jgi:hypothetical protein
MTRSLHAYTERGGQVPPASLHMSPWQRESKQWAIVMLWRKKMIVMLWRKKMKW